MQKQKRSKNVSRPKRLHVNELQELLVKVLRWKEVKERQLLVQVLKEVRDGNSSTGAKTGVGGYGTFNLGGRSIGEGGLPRPAYNVQEEGRVVVSITVNPAGQVIASEY